MTAAERAAWQRGAEWMRQQVVQELEASAWFEGAEYAADVRAIEIPPAPAPEGT